GPARSALDLAQQEAARPGEVRALRVVRPVLERLARRAVALRDPGQALELDLARAQVVLGELGLPGLAVERVVGVVAVAVVLRLGRDAGQPALAVRRAGLRLLVLRARPGREEKSQRSERDPRAVHLDPILSGLSGPRTGPALDAARDARPDAADVTSW